MLNPLFLLFVVYVPYLDDFRAAAGFGISQIVRLARFSLGRYFISMHFLKMFLATLAQIVFCCIVIDGTGAVVVHVWFPSSFACL